MCFTSPQKRLLTQDEDFELYHSTSTCQGPTLDTFDQPFLRDNFRFLFVLSVFHYVSVSTNSLCVAVPSPPKEKRFSLEGENREATTSRPKHKRKLAREKGMVLTLVLVLMLASSRFHGETKSFNACVHTCGFIASRATLGFIALFSSPATAYRKSL